MSDKLAAVILAYNEENHIQDCVRSVTWTDRVVMFADT
ncbi:MAG: glycosyltransferase family 2 protein, partial [Chloroflexi bacterium]|nr:glycosyltransferase family 2 protein [Chloroflexota bacterium]